MAEQAVKILIEEANDELTVPPSPTTTDTRIVDGCKSVANSLGALIKLASSNQKELLGLDQRRQLSQKIVSATQKLTHDMNTLSETAKCLMQGEVSEQDLVEAAENVSKSTKTFLQLYNLESKEKEVAKKMHSAGQEALDYTNGVISVTRQTMARKEQENFEVNMNMVEKLTLEIQAQALIIQKQKELTEAKQKLKIIQELRKEQQNPLYFGF